MSKVLVKLLVSRAGADFSQNRGDVVEVDVDEAERMLAAEQCELHREEPASELTPKPKPEAKAKAPKPPKEKAVKKPATETR